MQWTVRLETTTSAGDVQTTELVTFSRPAVVGTLAEVGLMLAADPVRHGRGRGAAVQGVSLPPTRAHGGSDGLAGLRAGDGPLHAGVGAGAGRVGRAHLVSGRSGYSGPLAASFAGKPGERAHPRGRPADRGGRPASRYGGHGCPGRAGQGRSSGREPDHRHARWRLHTRRARPSGSQLRGGLRQGGA